MLGYRCAQHPVIGDDSINDQRLFSWSGRALKPLPRRPCPHCERIIDVEQTGGISKHFVHSHCAFVSKRYYIDDDETISEGSRIEFKSKIDENVVRIMRLPPYNVTDSDLLGFDNYTLEQRCMNALYDAHGFGYGTLPPLMQRYYDLHVRAPRIHLRRDIAAIACAIIEENDLIWKLKYESPNGEHRECAMLGHDCVIDFDYENPPTECWEYRDGIVSLHPERFTHCRHFWMCDPCRERHDTCVDNLQYEREAPTILVKRKKKNEEDSTTSVYDSD